MMDAYEQEQADKTMFERYVSDADRHIDAKTFPYTRPGFSEKVCRFVAYEAQDINWLLAECDTKEGIGTMLVQLAEDNREADLPVPTVAIYDRLESVWITGPVEVQR